MIRAPSDILASRRLPVALAVVLGVILTVQVGRTAVGLMQTPDILPSGAPRAAVADRAVLARFDPFLGQGAVAETTSAGGWTLHGVRSGGGGFDTAILAGDDGRQQLYRVGEVLAPGVMLHTVAADHVLLSRGGGVSRVDFPEASSPPAAAAPAPIAPAGPAASTGGRVSPARFSADVAMSPRLRDGRVNGVTVQPRGQGASLQAAGLRAGDVIVSVNGTPIDSAERAADLALELQAGSSAEITYEREGRRVATTVQIEGPAR